MSFSFSFGALKLSILIGKVTKAVVDNFNKVKKKVQDVVPGQGVSAQNDENAAIKGSGEVVVQGNGTEIIKGKITDKVKAEAQAKLDAEAEKKLKKNKEREDASCEV